MWSLPNIVKKNSMNSKKEKENRKNTQFVLKNTKQFVESLQIANYFDWATNIFLLEKTNIISGDKNWLFCYYPFYISSYIFGEYYFLNNNFKKLLQLAGAFIIPNQSSPLMCVPITHENCVNDTKFKP